MTSITAAPTVFVEIVRSTDGLIHLARTIATVTDCGLANVELDTTVNISSFEEADPESYCRRCFARATDAE